MSKHFSSSIKHKMLERRWDEHVGVKNREKIRWWRHGAKVAGWRERMVASGHSPGQHHCKKKKEKDIVRFQCNIRKDFSVQHHAPQLSWSSNKVLACDVSFVFVVVVAAWFAAGSDHFLFMLCSFSVVVQDSFLAWLQKNGVWLVLHLSLLEGINLLTILIIGAKKGEVYQEMERSWDQIGKLPLTEQLRNYGRGNDRNPCENR